MPGQTLIKAGSVDGDDFEAIAGPPGMEIYTKHRPGWLKGFEGAQEKSGQ